MSLENAGCGCFKQHLNYAIERDICFLDITCKQDIKSYSRRCSPYLAKIVWFMCFQHCHHQDDSMSHSIDLILGAAQMLFYILARMLR